jgi:hypothetical protein
MNNLVIWLWKVVKHLHYNFFFKSVFQSCVDFSLDRDRLDFLRHFASFFVSLLFLRDLTLIWQKILWEMDRSHFRNFDVQKVLKSKFMPRFDNDQECPNYEVYNLMENSSCIFISSSVTIIVWISKALV